MFETVLLTGAPRSGSTLFCHLLNKLPNVLALHEPLAAEELCPSGKGDAAALCASIGAYAARVRLSVALQGTVMTKASADGIPENPIEEDKSGGGLRRSLVRLRELEVGDRRLDTGFLLGVKHNAAFTAALPVLGHAFPVYGIIRNPLALLASWGTVDLPIQRGRVPMGERFDAELKHKLDGLAEPLERQLVVLDWIFRSFLEFLPASRIVRYEALVADPVRVFRQIGACTENPKVRLPRLENRNSDYRAERLKGVYEGLMDAGDAVWEFYEKKDVQAVYRAMQGS